MHSVALLVITDIEFRFISILPFRSDHDLPACSISGVDIWDVLLSQTGQLAKWNRETLWFPPSLSQARAKMPKKRRKIIHVSEIRRNFNNNKQEWKLKLFCLTTATCYIQWQFGFMLANECLITMTGSQKIKFSQILISTSLEIISKILSTLTRVVISKLLDPVHAVFFISNETVDH